MFVGRLFNRIINAFTGAFAMATLILMLVWYINNTLGGWLPASALTSLERTRNYFMLATIFCAGTEYTLKRSIVFAGVFACVVVAVAAFMIYTDVSMI